MGKIIKSPKTDKRTETIKAKTQQAQKDFLEQLLKSPNIQTACRQNGISRATYYRWCEDDALFTEIAKRALLKGRKYFNDIIESKLISKALSGDSTCMIFYLKNNHQSYAERQLEEDAVKEIDLSPEQKKELAISVVRGGFAHTLFMNKLYNHEIFGKYFNEFNKIYKQIEEELGQEMIKKKEREEKRLGLMEEYLRG